VVFAGKIRLLTSAATILDLTLRRPDPRRGKSPGRGRGNELPGRRAPTYDRVMFSHVVIFWTDPANPQAVDELIAGAGKYLAPIPGIVHFHVGQMVPSDRAVVDRSYQVALNVVFTNKQAQDDYQVHPLHVDFVEQVFKPNCKRVVVYDFE
jgi:hypothetical protein